MRTEDPDFWEELTTGKSIRDAIPDDRFVVPEDEIPKADLEDALDDSDIPLATVIASMSGRDLGGVASRADGGLMSIVDAEAFDISAETTHHNDPEGSSAGPSSRVSEETESLGRGKRRPRPNKLYASSTFWRHYDADDEDSELI